MNLQRERKNLQRSIKIIFRKSRTPLALWVHFRTNLIAWPAAYFFVHMWLQGFAHRIQISIWTFVLWGKGVLLISFVTVSIHTFRAASSNPVNTLRYE
ncbi:MAG: hypothetical protein GF421_06235 [Candidatus Aminicenantes bacterium]|nr:hypothetical protein [Candidatus Aminicenantes bacterium]